MMEATTNTQLDQLLEELYIHKKKWAGLSIAKRIQLLKKCQDDTLAESEKWVRSACKAKEIDFASPLSGEEWLGGPLVTLRNLRILIEVLEEIQKNGRPSLKKQDLKKLKNGQIVVDIFPKNFWDKLLYYGFRAEVWLQKDVSEKDFFSNIAWTYQKKSEQKSTQQSDLESNANEGKLSLVLGAGNVSSIAPMDVLYKLFVENEVCLLKMNPVNEYIGPHLQKSFRSLVEAGFLKIAYGAADVGNYLVEHELIDNIHMTGSDRVHDIIVWGKPGKEQSENRKNKTPKLKKPITSELGCVTPVIVIPGNWSEKELQFQAENIANMVVNNASFNCNAAKILLTWKHWKQREDFLDLVEKELVKSHSRKAYYPGSEEKYVSFLRDHTEAKMLGRRKEDVIPWTTIFDVDPKNSQDIVFTTEAWCGILAEAPFDVDNTKAFVKAAVKFCNEKIWGTLSCSVIVDPKTQKQLGETFEHAIADLRYGSIVVNHWGALSYGFVYTTWGAFPGHHLNDIQSGIGVVHNAYMIDKPEKSVVYGPFTMPFKPPWFSSHAQGNHLAKKLCEFEHSPSMFKTFGIALSTLRG